jgi:hypothetical protein
MIRDVKYWIRFALLIKKAVNVCNGRLRTKDLKLINR